MEYTLGYLATAMFLNGLFAIRAPHQDCRIVFVISMIWPISILAIAGILLLDLIKWDVDIAESRKAFGFRKPGNPEIRGFALTLFTVEFQFYSKKKA